MGSCTTLSKLLVPPNQTGIERFLSTLLQEDYQVAGGEFWLHFISASTTKACLASFLAFKSPYQIDTGHKSNRDFGGTFTRHFLFPIKKNAIKLTMQSPGYGRLLSAANPLKSRRGIFFHILSSYEMNDFLIRWQWQSCKWKKSLFLLKQPCHGQIKHKQISWVRTVFNLAALLPAGLCSWFNKVFLTVINFFKVFKPSQVNIPKREWETSHHLQAQSIT